MPQPRGARSRTSAAGDMTGRKGAALAKEHAEEIAQRAQEMGMINQAQQVQEEDAIFDPASGDVVEGPDFVDALQQVGDGVMYADEDEVIEDTEQVTHSTITPVTDEVVEQPQAVVVDGGTRVIRLNSTLEDVTIGQNTNYNFVEGRRYRVPVHVANHLEEKGYVWH